MFTGSGDNFREKNYSGGSRTAFAESPEEHPPHGVISYIEFAV
jgi:hypothetical protein